VGLFGALTLLAGSIGGGVLVGYGFAVEERAWLVIGAAVFAPVLVIGGHLAARNETAPRTAALAAMSLLALCFVVAALVASNLWDTPASASTALSIASSDPGAHVYVHAVPEGRELISDRAVDAPLVGGRGYGFACEAVLPDGTRWARLADRDRWVPVSALRSSDGGAPTRLSTC
jgi:hypothetical protein